MNASADLLDLPSSAAFAFTGAADRGLIVHSAANDLTLHIDPLEVRVAQVGPRAVMAMGSSSANLVWRGRTIPGHVIHEYLVMRDINLTTRRSLRGLGNFEGLYLLTAEGEDLYVHRTSMQLTPGLEPRLGFAAREARSSILVLSSFRAVRHRWAQGIYRWPTAWVVQGGSGRRRFELDARTTTALSVFNWRVAGFGMGVVAGTLRAGARAVPVYGLAEVLCVPGLVRRLAGWRRHLLARERPGEPPHQNDRRRRGMSATSLRLGGPHAAGRSPGEGGRRPTMLLRYDGQRRFGARIPSPPPRSGDLGTRRHQPAGRSVNRDASRAEHYPRTAASRHPRSATRG